jgi:hypothetical protein
MRHIALIGLLVVTACVPMEAPREERTLPPPVVVAPPPPPPPPPDYCGANELQYLVGKHRTDIPVPVDPTRRRVTCTTCPVTMDYSATRLNIYYDGSNGIIKEVKCG